MQMEASRYLSVFNNKEDNKVSFDDLKMEYSGSLPDSLQMRYIKNKYPKKFFYDNKEYINLNKEKEVHKSIKTNCIIDVSFRYDYREINNSPTLIYQNDNVKIINNSFGNILKNKKEIRTEFYKNGFIINDVKYVLFQRTSSKSRLGQCLFIQKDMLENIQKWSRMGMTFKKDEVCDSASLMAYESLTFSGIIDTIKIEPKEILLIDDYKSKYTSLASVTSYDTKNKKLVVEERQEPQTSDIWDGQSLLDSSKFTGNFKNKGCMLLRNKFYKSCAFNTNIQKFFSDNNITEVKDMFGKIHKAKDIKLITTPNSLKALKFAYKISKRKDKIKQKRDMWEHWQKNIDYNFGICKTEKPSKFGDYNQLSYQMINSLPLKRDDIQQLAEYNIKQIYNINNNFDKFKEYLHIEDRLDITKDMLYNLCCINPDIQHTVLYKNKRRDIVDCLKNNMRKGRLLIKSDYAIMVSNPIEMLKQACGIAWGNTLHKPYQIYTPMYDDGVELTGFRNPHICSGNVCVFTNTKVDDICKYLNLTKNIVVINSYQNDILSRLQGADMDSDAILLTDNNIILKAAKQCGKFATPLNNIKGDKKQRLHNPEQIAEIDYIISENLIGQIVNLSQLFNSYYWDYRFRNEEEEKLQIIYNCVSQLSSLSQLEIDKAKKFFDLSVRGALKRISNTKFNQSQLNTLKKKKNSLSGKIKRRENKINKTTEDYKEIEKLITELQDINFKIDKLNSQIIIKTEEYNYKKLVLSDDDIKLINQCKNNYIEGKISKKEYIESVKVLKKFEIFIKHKQIKPLFFRYNSKDEKCKFKFFQAPMDYLLDIIEKDIDKAKPDKIKLKIGDLLNHDINTNRGDRKQANKIQEIAQDVRCKLKSLIYNEDFSYEEYQKYKQNKKNILYEGCTAMRKIKVSKLETIKLLLLRCYADGRVRKEELSDCKTILISLLWKVYPEMFIQCFKK